jgi:ATP-dependent protease HslVU (ClpYQ) peptidase subunit
MTCIVGLTENGIIYMGGDSASCVDCSIQIIKSPKVFKKGDLLLGVSGSPRLQDVLKYNFDFPEDVTLEPLEYLNRDFVPSLRECLSENGVLGVENEIESSESWILVGYKERLFIIEANFHVAESNKSYDAVGCGASEAMGALHALESIDEICDTSWLTPSLKIKIALETSAEFNCHVRGPFVAIDSKEERG